MSLYRGTEHERRISVDALLTFCCEIFERCGMSKPDAALLADSVVAADIRGIHSHGVLRLADYAAKLLHGGVDPRGQPVVVKDSGAALVIDGGNSMGQIGSYFAMRHAIERAAHVNVAVAAVRASNHCGAMFYYALQAVQAGMIGIAMTNALPTMAPWGGKDKIVGINPLAVGIPSGEEAPVLLDAAFSYSSHGKIRIYQQKGYPIPASWAFDENGEPTTETERALHGLLQPIGEYKGVGLAIVFGLLSTMLSGASYGTELGNMTDGAKAGEDGHLFVAINVAAFEDLSRFRIRVDAAIRQIRESRPVRDSVKLYAPGGLEREIESAYREHGIPLNQATWIDLERVAREIGVQPDWTK